VAKIAGQLPVKFVPGGVQIGEQQYVGAGVGLTMIYPNPLNAERYVLLLPEDYCGTKPWDYPDYVVLQPSASPPGNARILAQGTFDARWEVAK